MTREERVKYRIKKFQTLDGYVRLKGIKYSTLSKDLEISPVVFTDWKMGRSMPKTDKLIKIANYFNVPLETFVG